MKTMLLALLGVLALTALGGDEAIAKGRPLSAVLSGADEVPAGSGDPDGTGSAFLRLNSGQGRICFEIVVADILLPATFAHIHDAPAGVNGPVVVFLAAPDASGVSSGCVDVPRALVKDIRKNPQDYYINVHTSDFPAGAVRGQLSK